VITVLRPGFHIFMPVPLFGTLTTLRLPAEPPHLLMPNGKDDERVASVVGPHGVEYTPTPADRTRPLS
jgi:hypothetical protein